jgi:hypothetical protein
MGIGTRNERKSRLRAVLKEDREVRLVESLANTIDELYETLSKGVHGEVDFETALLCLRVTEHLVRYLLARGYMPN